MKKFFPKTLSSQTVLVLLIGLIFSHLLSMILYSSDRMEVLTQIGGRDTAQNISNIARIFERAPMDLRPALASVLQEERFKVWLTPKSPLTHQLKPESDTQSLRDYLHSQLNAPQKPLIHVRVHNQTPAKETTKGLPFIKRLLQGASEHQELQVSLRLGDMKTKEQWLNFAVDIPQSYSLWSFTSALSIFAMSIAVIGLSIWVVHRLTKPLRTFANAAARLGKNIEAPPLSEQGPLEIKEAAIAFNQMQTRLRRMIENRTLMLAAISHDLRTPITLLRLRSELVENTEEREKMLTTLENMEQMIASTLDFARQDADNEARRKVDLNALVASICDDLSDAGFNVTFTDPETDPVKCLYDCRPLSLHRAITNLINNALKYGERAHVSLHQDQNKITITVTDNGPGIKENQLVDVFQPFYRCEDSRNLDTGGTGLGLSVVQSVAHAHGGDIRLTNQKQGGLKAELQLPV